MFDRYGRAKGYGQMAPGRDVEQEDEAAGAALPDINAAIQGGVPQGGASTPFKGAQQTVGAQPQEPSAIDRLGQGMTAPQQGQLPQGPDTSKWNTKGYAAPQYTASSNINNVLEGFDAGKWNDANYQDPKYVFGRILQEASGGTGYLKEQAQRDMAVKNILAAYPGAKFNGKDKIIMPDGGVIDIFGGAGSGLYKGTFQLQEGTGRDPQGNLLPVNGQGADIQNAILGAQPTVNAGSSVDMRAEIMKALQMDPKFAALAGGYGY